MNFEDKIMTLAMKEAIKAYKCGDVPVGVIIIKNNKIISKAHNKKEKKNNAILHAEIIAIQKACKKLKTWHLDDCILYTTLEPCMMCSGAIIQARIKKVYYATQNKNFGILISKKFHQSDDIFIQATKKKYQYQSSNMLKEFFLEKRNK